MAGKNCTGVQSNNSGNLKNSRAFCEGREYRARTTQIAAPKADNPHEAGSEAFASWDLGWIDADDSVGTYAGPVGCCSALGDVLP